MAGLAVPVAASAAEPPPAPPETAAQARDQIEVLKDPASWQRYGTTAAHSAYKTEAGEPADAQGQVALPDGSQAPAVAQLDPASAGAAPGGDPTATDLLARGKYLVDMADCASCHSRSGGHRFAGGRPMAMPFGTIYTPNITPDQEFGMGKYTEADLTRVFRKGINRVGNYIYPGMPYPWYSSMRQEDIHAIYAYLMSQAPVHYRVPHNEIYFPFTIRPLISVWNALLTPSYIFKDDPNHSALVNRGDYIVNSFAHCSECHNGYTLLGNGPQAKPLQGGVITKWATPNITNNKISGLGRYTDDQIFRYLKNGYDDVMGPSVGPMRETTDVSLSKMRDEDIRAIVAYLRTQDRPATYSAYKRTAYLKPNPPGADIYFSQCASCHGADGRGEKGIVPALDGNGMVLAAGPHNVINVIIGGVEAYGTFGVMPALGTGMTDQQVADVSNFVRQAWSNNAPPNATAYQVAVNRREADGASGSLLNGERTGGCPT
ncbi:MAG: c-type cytochrome, partial [Gluconacetobacter diazotrophicus]|nr:c-type cytochrome [Gluconacetobacter diazotrophicus]